MGTTTEARDVKASQTSGKLFFLLFYYFTKGTIIIVIYRQYAHHNTTLRRERAYSPPKTLTPMQTKGEGQGMATRR